LSQKNNSFLSHVTDTFALQVTQMDLILAKWEKVILSANIEGISLAFDVLYVVL
jgi:hypothetical protein